MNQLYKFITIRPDFDTDYYVSATDAFFVTIRVSLWQTVSNHRRVEVDRTTRLCCSYRFKL